MPRYFFHITDGVEIRDEIGSDLPDIEAVRKEATTSSLEIIRYLGEKFWTSKLWSMTVEDESGAEMLRLEVSGKMTMQP